MEKKNAVYTITEDQSPEEARREHVMLVVRNLAAVRRVRGVLPAMRSCFEQITQAK